MKWRIGIDIGGTFSDLIAVSEESGECRLSKHPSSMKDPSTARFMVGMAAGSWLVLRIPQAATVGNWTLSVLQAMAAASPLLLYLVLHSLGAMTNGQGPLLASQVLFPAMAVACGLLGGYQYQIASRVYFSDSASEASPAALYAVDLVGACLGAIAVSAYLVPVFGMLRTGWLIAAVNLAPALAVLPGARRRPGQ